MTQKQFIKARSDLKLSQAALGRALGKDTGTISRYERGVFKIPLVVELAMETLATRAASKTIGL